MICKKLLPAAIFIFLLLPATILHAQDRTVTGRVTNANDGTGVPSASVTVKDATMGTQTDAAGNFSLSVPANATTLVVSSVNFTSQEVSIEGKSQVNVTLVPLDASLGEVVVIGYGTARKKDLTGSIATVTAKDFQKGTVTSPEQLMLGKVAGVNIISNSGAPGSGSTITIRGVSSLSTSDPLIVIDGVILGGGGISGSANFLSTINPNDIESFSILKDASSAAIYGARAANGVILITTKKGKTGKPRFNFLSQVSLSSLSKQMDVLTADEFRELVGSKGNASQIGQLGQASTNWQDEIYQKALTFENNFSVSGGTRGKIKMPYRISVGYLTQEGILKTGSLKRLSGALNLNPSFLSDHLKLDISLKGSNSKSQFANQGAIGEAVRFNPTLPVYSGSDRYGGFYELLDPNSVTGLRALAPSNPLSLLMGRDDASNVNRSIGNIQADYKFHFLPSLRINVNVGYDVARGTGDVIVNDSVKQGYMRDLDEFGIRKGGTRNTYRQDMTNTFFETYLNYATDIPTISSRIDLTAGYGFYDNKYKTYNFADYFYDGTQRVNSEPNFPFDIQQNRLASYYGRLNYTLANKYIFTLNGRTDGSSKINPDDRWVAYYSAALAWRISEENFLKNNNTVSDLKLRLGYGTSAMQDGIGNYTWMNVYGYSNNTAHYQLGNTFYQMVRPGSYNAGLTWQTTLTKNIGLDFGFLNNRITGSVDAFIRESSKLLNRVAQSAGVAFAPEETANVGNMESRGIEFNINSTIIKKRDVTLDFGFNAAFIKNEITRLTRTDDPNYEGMRWGGRSGGTGGSILINRVGHSRGAFYVFKQVYDQDGNPIDNLFEDLNRDGVITSADRYLYKKIDPDVIMGFHGNLAYKKWNFGFIARASIGGYIYNNVASATGTVRNIFDPLGYIANGSAEVLKSGFSGEGDLFYDSDYFVQNASFFRMDNVNVGYDLGKVFNDKANLRLSAILQNAFIITKYKGVDPEIVSGIDNNFYPRPRTVVVSLNLDF